MSPTTTGSIAFMLNKVFGVYYRGCTLGILGRQYLAQPLDVNLGRLSSRREFPCEILYARNPSNSFN